MKKTEIEIQNYPIPEEIIDQKAIKIWEMTAGKKIKSPGRLVMLERALLLLQRINAMEEKIKVDGFMLEGKSMGHSHPLLKILSKDLALLNKFWLNLGLASEPPQIEKWE